MNLSNILRFLHILAAAVWMGSALFWPGAVRRALAAGQAFLGPALAQARTGLGLDLWSGAATIAFGLVYASPAGGGPLRTGIYVGIVLALARIALLFGLARPALAKLTAAAAGGDLAGANAAAKTLPAYAGSAHLLWVLALATMVFSF